MGFLGWLKKLFVPSQHNAYRPHLLRRRALLFFLGLALLAEGALVANMLARQSGHDFLATVIQSEVILLTNAERAQNQVAALTENSLLDRSAQAKADDMAAKGYFAHVDLQGRQPWVWIAAAGYDYQYAGENLAVRFVDSKDVVTAWMASPTHRANIVKANYTEVGVGIAQGTYKGQSATFVVQHFGKPAAKKVAALPPAPAPAETPAPSAAPVQTPALGQVLGQESASAPSVTDSVLRQVGRMLAEPRTATAFVLGGVATLLMLALAFAFFRHIQIQAHDLLVPGAVVAGTALMLLVVNSALLPSVASETSQPAGAALFHDSGGVVIPAEAVSDER